MHLPLSKIFIGDSYVISGYIAQKFYKLKNKILNFLRVLLSLMVKKRIFIQKHQFSQK